MWKMILTTSCKWDHTFPNPNARRRLRTLIRRAGSPASNRAISSMCTCSSYLTIVLITFTIQARLPGPSHPSGHVLQGEYCTETRTHRILLTWLQTIAPGARLGWFTCNPRFAERLERAGETSAQAPCGFGQVRQNHRSSKPPYTMASACVLIRWSLLSSLSLLNC